MSDISKLILEIIVIIEASAIVSFFSMALYYGIKAWRCEVVKTTCSWLTKYSTILSGIWTLIFLYILVQTVLGNSPLKSDEFGAIFIRPAILLTSVKTFINRKMEYIRLCIGGNYPCQKIQN